MEYIESLKKKEKSMVKTFLTNKNLNENDTKRILYQLFFDRDFSCLANDTVLWKHPHYTDIARIIHEQDDYLTNPFTVEEGVVECYKCGSKKVWSVQKQIRSADEPMTTISRCTECGNNWTYSG